ncbi:hypothetical protein Q9L58_004655 [Maublancomyces gigas]|uniref:HNH nuclease domain-containing protein n=1 Tax=Discina gigas TaxID=1032678 RepID=A0ABR3GKD3_9PEZI
MASDTHTFAVRPQTPNRRLRNQSSLERLLSFTLLSPPPIPEEVHEASLIYHLILDDCKRAHAVISPRGKGGNSDGADSKEIETGTGYREKDEEFYETEHNEEDQEAESEDEEEDDGTVHLHKLFRALYRYSPTDDGRANIVRMVLHGLFPPTPTTDARAPSYTARALKSIIPRARCWVDYTPDQRLSVYHTLAAFASEFLEGFFVPLKAQGRNTPHISSLISPTSRSEISPAQATTARLHDLRSRCLLRDGHRCVVTGKFDRSHIQNLMKKTTRARRRALPAGYSTEAAHIIPHALNALDSTTGALAPSKHYVWRIMNMFDPGISRILEGTAINSPANALMLLPELHQRFGRLECYLEEVDENTYSFKHTARSVQIEAFYEPRAPRLAFANHEPEGTPHSPLPSARLLKFHRACCLILAMSGAAEYVERLLDDTEELMLKGMLAADGSSDLGLVLRLKGLYSDDEEEGELEEEVLAEWGHGSLSPTVAVC